MPTLRISGDIAQTQAPEYLTGMTSITLEPDHPAQVHSLMVSFADRPAMVIVEAFDDQSCAAYFAEESGVSSSGPTLRDAILSLYEDAQSELDLLGKYGDGRLSPPLARRKKFLEGIFRGP